MIDRLPSSTTLPARDMPARAASMSATGAPHKVLRMAKVGRIDGMMPIWETASTPAQAIENNLSQAAGGTPKIEGTLAYRETPEQTSNQEFGFADLLDMVNPLQHIPVISHLYRQITGDTIKGPAQIIGGAIFGGAAGLAGGLANVIMEKETGKDVTGNAVAFLKDGKLPQLKKYDESLPGQLLAFADLSHDPNTKIERISKRPVWERN